MNNHEKLDLICRQFGSLQHPNPPMRIDWMPTVGWNLLFERENQEAVCLVYLYVENAIGIADANQSGYTPTPAVIREGVNGEEAVDWFNEHILGLSRAEALKIVASTMRGV